MNILPLRVAGLFKGGIVIVSALLSTAASAQVKVLMSGGFTGVPNA